MGALVLAGGMGTRLGYDHPKGCYPFSPEKKKSLFQIVSEKCIAASKKRGEKLFIAFMTSPENDLETRKFFHDHNRFGLDRDQLFFFAQGHLPLLSEEGKPLEIMGASGNGDVFKKFKTSGVLNAWKEKGVEHVNVIPIDNPLADPYDEKLLQSHMLNGDEVTIKCIQRTSPDEKVGILIPEGKSYKVIEYSEATQEMKEAMDQYPLANLSLFIVSMPFMEKMADINLPTHTARKKLSNEEEADWILKKETFIFDMLPFAEKVSTLVYLREDCFAPVKNKEGKDSVETARKLVYNYEKKLFERLYQKPMPPYPFEIPIADYYAM